MTTRPYLIRWGEIALDKNIGNTRKSGLQMQDDKKTLPVFVKYGLIAVAVIAAIVIGMLIYFNIAGSYVATVDGQKIKTGAFKYYLESQKQTMYANAYAEDPSITEETFWKTKISGNDATEVAKQIALETARDMKIQFIKAKEAKVELTSDQIKSIDSNIQTSIIDVMDPSKTASGSGNKIRANKEFEKAYGFSLDDLREVQIEYYTVLKYQSSEISKINDADANVDNYYSSKPEWFKEDTSYRKGLEEAVWARHILITVNEGATQEEKDTARKKAEMLISNLKSGADFAQLAKENSDDDGSKDSGGAYLFGKGKMDEAFETAAFALKPGQITETPVLSAFGYHIIKLEEKYAQDEPVSLRCAKEYYEYGTAFVKYKLYMEKVGEWAKEDKYKVIKNNSVYNSVT